MRLRARFLGPPALEQDIRLTSLLPGKGVALAAFLATEGVPVGRERLVYLLWPDHPEPIARTNLRQLLRGLKGKLLGTMLELDGSTLRFVGQSDLGQFEQARAEGDWESALSLWRGEFLAGLEADTDTLDDWLQAQREYWNRCWREAMLGRVGQLEQLGQATLALEQLEKLIQTDWLSEELYARAIRLAQKLGQRERALELLGRLEQRLQDELGLKPLPQTVALVQGPLQVSSVEEVVSSAEIPMVGRQTAREQLTRWASAPGLVLVSGEGGVGKTRLLEEALAGALVLRAEESLLQSPFHPLVRALEAMQASLGILPEATRQELRRLLPQLPAPNPEPDPNPEVARVRLLNALLEGVRLLAGDRALVLEDLHWADEATLGFVVEWAARWAEAGGTMIITMRPEEAPARPGLERALQQLRGMPVLRGEIRLERLGLPGTQALVGAFLGLSEGPPLFAERIHRASGGNPLFTLEVLRQLQAEGTLRQDETGGWHTPYDETTLDYAELTLPESVRASLQRRLSLLSEAERRVADAAAVCGVGMSLSLAERVTGLAGWGLADAVEQLVRMGLLREEGLTYRMSHDLLRQHTYAEIAPVRRRLLHCSFAETLEPADFVAAAGHWQAAGELALAAKAWLEAGTGFHERGLLQDAESLYQLAVEHSPQPEDRLWAQVHLAVLLRSTGRFGPAVEMLREVLEEATQPRSRVMALVVRAELYFITGQPQLAVALVEEAQALFQAHPPDAYIRQHVLGIQIKVADYLGQHQRAIELLTEELERSKAQPFHPNRTSFRIQLAHHLDALERYPEALPIYRSVLKLTRARGDHLNLVYAAGQHLFCCTRLGCAEEGLEAAEYALGLGEFESTAGLRYHLVRAYLSLARFSEAVQHAEVLVERYDLPYIRCVGWGVLAEAYAGLGWKEKAREAVHQALHFARAGVGPSFMVRAVTSALRVGGPEQAAQAKALLEGLSLEAVPAYHRADLEVALRQNAGV